MQLKNIILVVVIMAMAIIAFYFIGVGPSELTITSNDTSMNKQITTLNISGTTSSYATVTINGENVPVDANGNFYKVVQVQNGTHVYTVAAKAPFKSTYQLNITSKRNEDSDGSASGVWYYNSTSYKEYQ